MEQNKNMGETIQEVKAQFEEIPDLREEFVLLLSNHWQRNPEEVRQSTCESWATVLVLLAKAAHKANQMVNEALSCKPNPQARQN